MTKVSIFVKSNRSETQLIKQWGQPRRSRFKCAHKDPKLSADYSLDFLQFFQNNQVTGKRLKRFSTILDKRFHLRETNRGQD